MNRNLRNDQKMSDRNLQGLRKITYLKKYGVQQFPYPGRRRYAPLVYQCEDGGIIISNDVFGLTIRQFEEMYKACLDRRKAQEQYILNLRYPDKTSDEYLEYLEERTDCNKDFRSWNGNVLKVKCLYDYLVNTLGTEIDIRKRQQLFIIQDLTQNTMMLCGDSITTEISSGSLAEGLDIPGSDRDIMYVMKNVDVIQNIKNIKYPIYRTTLLMETDNDHPGFVRLRLIAGGDGDTNFITCESFESSKNGLYISVTKFINNINRKLPHLQLSSHGPCLSDKNQTIDSAFCFRSKYLPFKAMQWASRYRQQWPSNSAIDKIIEYGCLLVPIGPRTQPGCDVLWRLSFSMAEKQLMHSLNYIQLLCYGLLKLALKHIIDTQDQAKGLLCSYFLKTALFWVSEEVDIDTFQLPKIFYCFTLCINKLILWVHNCFCPNYFIPEHNMFLGKINSDNNEILIQVLNSMTNDGIDALIMNLISNDKDKSRFLYTKETSSFILLDFLFFRVCGIGPTTHISHYLKALVFIESLIKSKSSTFIIGVCKYVHAEISQYAAQVLPPPSITKEAGNIHKSYERHLLDGTKTDSVSGWLLYASFYYVTGQFDVTLRLTDTVLSRCSPDMVLIGCVYYHERHIKNYRNHVHSTMTLNDKMRIATLKSIIYSQNSSLIPWELQLEVKDKEMCLPPTVMSHCLRFLCFHHLGDFPRRQTALHDLYKTVNDTKKNSVFLSMLSNSFTILGVCYEVSGEKDIAYECYDKALQCESGICPSAKARKLKLLQI